MSESATTDGMYLRDLCTRVLGLAASARVDAELLRRGTPQEAGTDYLVAYTAAHVDALDAKGLASVAELMKTRRGVVLWTSKLAITDKRDTLRGYLLSKCEQLAADAITHHGAMLELDRAELASRAAKAPPPHAATFDEAVRCLAAGDLVDVSWQPGGSGRSTVSGGPGTKRARFVRWARGEALRRFVANVEAVDAKGIPTGRFGSDRTFAVEEIVSIYPREDAEERAIRELPPATLQAVRTWGYNEVPVSAVDQGGITAAHVEACMDSLHISLRAKYAPLIEGALAGVLLAQSLARSQREDAAAAIAKKRGAERPLPQEPITVTPVGQQADMGEAIARSSVGVGLANIAENGLYAELAVIDAELAPAPAKKRKPRKAALAKLEDEDGVDGPFERAMVAAEREDARTYVATGPVIASAKLEARLAERGVALPAMVDGTAIVSSKPWSQCMPAEIIADIEAIAAPVQEPNPDRIALTVHATAEELASYLANAGDEFVQDLLRRVCEHRGWLMRTFDSEEAARASDDAVAYLRWREVKKVASHGED